jgi:hypothetical protein
MMGASNRLLPAEWKPEDPEQKRELIAISLCSGRLCARDAVSSVTAARGGYIRADVGIVICRTECQPSLLSFCF